MLLELISSPSHAVETRHWRHDMNSYIPFLFKNDYENYVWPRGWCGIYLPLRKQDFNYSLHGWSWWFHQFGSLIRLKNLLNRGNSGINFSRKVTSRKSWSYLMHNLLLPIITTSPPGSPYQSFASSFSSPNDERFCYSNPNTSNSSSRDGSSPHSSLQRQSWVVFPSCDTIPLGTFRKPSWWDSSRITRHLTQSVSSTDLPKAGTETTGNSISQPFFCSSHRRGRTTCMPCWYCWETTIRLPHSLTSAYRRFSMCWREWCGTWTIGKIPASYSHIASQDGLVFQEAALSRQKY